jgi:hypothetical protein
MTVWHEINLLKQTLTVPKHCEMFGKSAGPVFSSHKMSMNIEDLEQSRY